MKTHLFLLVTNMKLVSTLLRQQVAEVPMSMKNKKVSYCTVSQNSQPTDYLISVVALLRVQQ